MELNTKSQNARFSVISEAPILRKLHSVLQAPAGSSFQKILAWTTGIGFGIVIVGLVTGLIPPPKHVLADSSRIVSIYSDGQKKVITTDAPTVSQALKEAGVKLGTGDAVEPAPATVLPNGFFNINVYRSRPVVVDDGLNHQTIQTASQSPRLMAEAAGFTVYPEDTFKVSTIEDVVAAGVVGQQVVIRRAVPVTLSADGQQTAVRTQAATVGGVLTERDVALGPQDTVLPGRDTKVAPGMTIQINRVKVVVLQQTDAIPHDTQNVKDATLDIGTTKVQEAGSDGASVSTFRVHYQNGVEQSRELLAKQQTKAPVTAVVRVGTKINYSANPVGLGRQLAAERGWTGSEWQSLYQLWDRESGWNPNSHNGSSGACGIPQAYPCSKIVDKSPAGQIRWGLDYIAGKYGDPNRAWAYWQNNHSY